MKHLKCLKCGHEFEGFVGDGCPNCHAGVVENFIGKKENETKKFDKLLRRLATLSEIKTRARNFIIDATGNWETGEGNLLLKLINDFDNEAI